jgi:hypothetical protein
MATYTKQTGGLTGAAVTYGAVTASDDFVNDGNSRLHVKNASGSPCTVTFNSIAACDQGFDHDQIVTVPAGSDRIIGPFPARFTDPNNGNKTGVTYSPTTSITAALLG